MLDAQMLAKRVFELVMKRAVVGHPLVVPDLLQIRSELRKRRQIRLGHRHKASFLIVHVVARTVTASFPIRDARSLGPRPASDAIVLFSVKIDTRVTQRRSTFPVLAAAAEALQHNDLPLRSRLTVRMRQASIPPKTRPIRPCAHRLCGRALTACAATRARGFRGAPPTP